MNDEAEDEDGDDDGEDEDEDELILTKKDKETLDAVVSGVLEESRGLPDTEDLEAPGAQEAAAEAAVNGRSHRSHLNLVAFIFLESLILTAQK